MPPLRLLACGEVCAWGKNSHKNKAEQRKRQPYKGSLLSLRKNGQIFITTYQIFRVTNKIMSSNDALTPAHVTSFLELLHNPPATEELHALSAGLDGEAASIPENLNLWEFIKNSPDTVVNAVTNNFLAEKVPVGQGARLRDFVASHPDLRGNESFQNWTSLDGKKQEDMLIETPRK